MEEQFGYNHEGSYEFEQERLINKMPKAQQDKIRYELDNHETEWVQTPMKKKTKKNAPLDELYQMIISKEYKKDFSAA